MPLSTISDRIAHAAYVPNYTFSTESKKQRKEVRNYLKRTIFIFFFIFLLMVVVSFVIVYSVFYIQFSHIEQDQHQKIIEEESGRNESKVSPKCVDGKFACKTAAGTESFIECSKVCNGRIDCGDQSDEHLACQCKEDEKKCSHGGCIPEQMFCDSVHDCPHEFDYSDEMDCHCKQDEYKCRNGKCLSLAEVYCNGVDDCEDNSDEPDNCKCHSSQISCGHGEICIAEYYTCDGVPDCPNTFLDELNCECEEEKMFKCRNGICRRKDMLCDGIKDCLDNSDEDNCEE